MASPGKKPAWERAGFATPNAYTKANRKSKEWSRKHSLKPNSQWRDSYTPEQKGSYYQAFVSDTTGIEAHYRRNHDPLAEDPDRGSKYLHKFLVKDTKHVTEDEWKQNYLGLN